MKKYSLSAATWIAALFLGIFTVYAGQLIGSAVQAQKQEQAENNDIKPPASSAQITAERIAGLNTVVLTEETTETEPENNNVTEEFIAEGDYYIIGDAPKGFGKFIELSITTRDYSENSPESNLDYVEIPPEGFLETNKRFAFKRILIANKKIAFATESKNGISYEFTGAFVDEKVEYKNAGGLKITQYALIKGDLVKKRGGKKVAKSEVKFAAGGC